MPTRKTSIVRSKKSAARSDRTAAGKRISVAAREIAAYLRGEGPSLSSYEIVVPDAVDVAAMRRRLGLSQSAFARSFGLDLDAVQAWEQGAAAQIVPRGSF